MQVTISACLSANILYRSGLGKFLCGVVDFMNMGIGSLRTGIFNVADMAIMAGVILLIFYGNTHQQKQKPTSALK